MAAADYNAVVQQLYVSYFGRPADYYGLQNFEAQLNALGAPTTVTDLNTAVQADPTSALAKLVNSFSSAPESVALYGTGTDIISISKFVNAIYNNVLNRDADTDGGTFWINEIVSGRLSKANAALAITQGAMANTSAQGLLDAVTVSNKAAVADDFTKSLDSIAKINSYSGDTAAGVARDLLGTVDNTTNLTTEHAAVVDAINGLIPVVVVNTVLTTGTDNFVGTSANDVISASLHGTDPTLTAFDTIDGGVGTNTLNINDFATTGTTNPLNGVSIKNIQNLNVQSQTAVSVDSSTVAGVTKLSVSAVGAETVAAATTTAVTANASAVAGNNVTVSGGSSITANVAGVTGLGTIAIGSATTAGAIVATVSDAAPGSANSTGSAINVTGGTTVTVTQNIAAATSTVNVDPTLSGTAFAATGGAINVKGGAATTSVTVNQTAAVDAVAGRTGVTAVAGVTEKSTVTWNGFATAVVGSQSIGGATVTSDGSTTFTAAQVAAVAAGGTVTGLSLTAPTLWTITAGTTPGQSVFTSVSANTSVADITGAGATGSGTAPTVSSTTQGVTTVVGVAAVTAVGGVVNGDVTITDVNSANTDGTKASTITSVTLNNFANATVSTNALSTLSLTNGSGTVTVNDNLATTKATALALTVNGVDSTLVDSKVQTLNITSTGAASDLVVTGAAVKAITVAGDKALDLTGSTVANATSITSSNTAGVTVTLNAAETGSFTAGNNVVTLAANATKAVTFGAGDDTVVVSTLNGATIAGGAGNNTLQMSGTDAATASGVAQFAAGFTGFNRLAITTPGSATIDANALGGFNYVTTSGATALTINSLTSGATLALTDAGTAYAANLTGSLAATNDVLNVRLSGEGATSFGTVTANNVETINVVATDTADTLNGTSNAQLTIANSDVKTIAVSGTSHTSLTAASTALTSFDASGLVVAGAGAAGTGISFTTGVLAASTTGAVATIKGSANGGDVIDASASLKGVTITETKGVNTIKGSATVASTLTGGTGADTIVGGSGKDVIVGGGGADKITGGAGADSITISGNTSTIIQGANHSGTNATLNTATSELTATFDVIKGVTAGTKIDLSGISTTLAIGSGDLAATNLAGVTGHVVFAAGTFDAANGIFAYGAAGADTVVTYDVAGHFESIVLVGYHAASTTAIASGIVTLA
jgi:S-layer protein